MCVRSVGSSHRSLAEYFDCNPTSGLAPETVNKQKEFSSLFCSRHRLNTMNDIDTDLDIIERSRCRSIDELIEERNFFTRELKNLLLQELNPGLGYKRNPPSCRNIF